MTDSKQVSIQDEEVLNYPDVDISHLYKKIPNRFLLSVAISKRARQIMEGEKPLVDHIPGKPMNPVALAIKELEADLIDVSIKEEIDEELEMLEKLDKNLDAKLDAAKETTEEPKKAKKSKSKI